MMRWGPVGVLILVLATTGQAVAGVHLGPVAGLNMTSLSGDAPSKVKLQSRIGPALGAVIEFDLTEDVRLSVQPMYVQKGGKLAFEIRGEREPRDSLEVSLDYVSVPVVAKILAGSGKTYVVGGLDLGFLTGATLSGAGPDEDVKDLFRDVDLSALFGFGVALPVGRPTLTLELRYSQSVLNVAASDGSADRPFPARTRSTGFQFFAGLLIPLGGSPR